MIIVAVGGNQPNSGQTLRQTLESALELFSYYGLTVTARSGWYQTKAVTQTPQPDFLNAVVRLESGLSPKEILVILHRIEARCGRVRRRRWEERSVDLDLIDYHGQVFEEKNRRGEELPGVPAALWLPLSLPHPRMAARAFVLRPLADIAPDWRHPVLGVGVFDLLRGVEGGVNGEIRRLEA